MFRAYPPDVPPFLLVQSGNSLYIGNDLDGTFNIVPTFTGTYDNHCTYQQQYNPKINKWCIFICDGVHVPRVCTSDGAINSVATGAGWLPNSMTTLGPITPKYVAEWQYSLVYAGEPSDPTSLYISDPLNPEAFNGFSITDSQGVNYIPYYPAGRDGSLGVITGIAVVGANLVIFYTNGIVTATNTGAYGALEYTFQRLSSSIGCVAPRSIVLMDGYVAFYGGTRMYCTDGATYLSPIPDELPTYYNGNQFSARPALIKTDSTVFGVRHYDEIIWSFDSTGTGILDTQIVFNQAANKNWAPGNLVGGAWSTWTGMAINAAVDCRGPGDIGQFFWGSSLGDVIGQHDATNNGTSITSAFSDFGKPIAVEIRAKSFFFDKPAHLKFVQALYVMCVFDTQGAAYNVSITPYIYFDQAQVFSPNPIQFTVAAGGTTWGSQPWGTFIFESAELTYQNSQKSYFNSNSLGQSVSPGITESSVYPINLIGFIIEATIDPPQP